MTLTTGARVGPYEVTGLLGTGGMGEVYRARDTRLNRDVALKVLPDAFALDRERLARFTREAQVLASLTHPNIGAIYGLEEVGPPAAGPHVRALVLELIEGPTLADLTAKGPLPVPEALSIARQICDALDAAHDQGIVHRDLKPANIKLGPDGSAKVLDFGLAKAVEAAPSAADPSMSPTLTSPALVSGVGVILGTAAYMSPEQARGKPVDKRSDVWAFGCVLFEMLAGRRAFDGEDVTDTLSRVLQREPDFSALPAGTPPGVRKLLIKCLEKDRNKRLPQIAVAAFQIDEALMASSQSFTDTGTRVPVRSRRLAQVLTPTLIVGALIGAAIIWRSAPRQAASPVTRLLVGVTPADQIGGTDGRPATTAFALSPDGRTLVFSAVRGNQRAIYVRHLDQPEATPIPGTEGGVGPFFSPDGRSVGYWTAGEIRKVPLAGGPPVRVSETGQVFGASWGDDDRIVFAGATGGLVDVPAAGGNPVAVTTADSGRDEVSHRLPHVLPGGGAILFTVTRNRFPRWDQTQVHVYSRQTKISKLLVDGGADARYASSGHLLYVREGVLLAAPFDLSRLEVTGGPVGVVSNVMQAAYFRGTGGDTGAAQVSISSTGTLVYAAGGVSPSQEQSVVEVDRTGRSKPFPIAPDAFRTLRLSPDGEQLALSTLGRDSAIWLYTLARGTLTKLAAAGRGVAPVWTPDGQRITYAAGTSGPDNLHWIRADGGGSSELLVASERNLVAGTWSPDGRELFYYQLANETTSTATAGPTIWAQDVARKSAPTAVSASLANAGGIDVSPDGRWIAYHSAESGQLQVFVQAYPGPGPRYQVSTDGGTSPIWRADGRELFYARTDTGIPARQSGEVRMMAVAVTTRPAFTFGTPTQLFAGRYSMNGPARGYDVTADGQRFLMLQVRDRAPDVIAQVNLVQNWTEELKRLMPN